MLFLAAASQCWIKLSKYVKENFLYLLILNQILVETVTECIKKKASRFRWLSVEKKFVLSISASSIQALRQAVAEPVEAVEVTVFRLW